MIITTTPNIEGKQIVEYKQVVFGGSDCWGKLHP